MARRQKQKEHYQEHKQEKHDYYVAHKEQHRERMRLLEQRKRQTEPCYRLRKNVSRLVSFYLQKIGAQPKGVSFFETVGYTLEDLKSHLESLWESWMSWDNYGSYRRDGPRTWNLDHVIPQSKLLYDSVRHPNFSQCWALTNLRPLCSKQNGEKRANLIEAVVISRSV